MTTGREREREREREMVFGETLQAAGTHVVLDKTVCGALSAELGLNVMRTIFSS